MARLKKVIALFVLFTVTLTLLPAVSLAMFDVKDNSIGRLLSQCSLSLRSERNPVVTVTVPETGERKVVSEAEFLCGIVASQMPPEYDDEAIKAQAVVSYTLLQYRRRHGFPQEEQSFLTGEQMKQKWGSNYTQTYSRIERLVGQVYGEYIAYEGEPILAAYHEISCGLTEYGGNIWEGAFPYLAPVESRGDLCAEEYRSALRLTEDAFSSVCREKLGISPDKAAREWLGECVRSDSGYVMSQYLCGKPFTGQKLRNAFGLRSACFTLKHEGNEFVFDVKGIGHGARMSQFGANLMALDGKSYREILAHYYKGTELQKK